MSQDETLRALARKAAETGALSDQVELIRARIRAGVVAERHVAAAAYLGHEAARVLCPKARDRRRSLYAKNLDQFQTWLDKLAPHGDDVMLRASLAALRKVASHPEARLNLTPATLDAAEAWAVGGPRPAEHQGLVDGREGHAARYLGLACRGIAHFANAGKCVLLMSVIRDEVIPWAIGDRDPIAARVHGESPPIVTQPEPETDVPF